MKKTREQQNKLRMWQERLGANDTAYELQYRKMDRREELYLGSNLLTPVTERQRADRTPHVRNLCAELIEAQVDSTIPQPKVTAVRRKDERLAKIVEDMLRNELDRLPFEELNDLMSRTVPIQGGAAFLVEWDNGKSGRDAVGDLTVSMVHPKQIVPQDGVYTGIADMDYLLLKIPQTKAYIRRRYHVDVEDETETEPDIRGSGEDDAADDLVTQYVAYYRNRSGGIGLYSWVGETPLEDLEDYQARRLRRCARCGALEPASDEPLTAPLPPGGESSAGRGPSSFPFGNRFAGFPNGGDAEPLAASLPPDGREWQGAAMQWTGEELLPEKPGKREKGRRVCPYCGASHWEEQEEDFEEVYTPILRSDGTVIPGATPRLVPSETRVDELGLPVLETVLEPNRIPYYKPDIYPVILQKNVSVYGQFLGDSDIDKIADQQNTMNVLSNKIIEKICKAGSYLTLPPSAKIRVDGEDVKEIRVSSPADLQMIGVYTLEGDISQDMEFRNEVYEESRQITGITDSFQGRSDSTATSGKAKEFAAAQSAGRLESKRRMKDAAYAQLFEAMFKFKLAYADEPRPVIARDIHGDTEYGVFNRYDFLEQDAAGQWRWIDDFLFSCDTSAPLASNREAMWQETRMNLQTGAFGDPADLKTLILFWTKMEMLHYPGAAETRSYLEEELREAQLQQQRMQQMQLQQAQAEMQAQAMQQQTAAAEQTVRQATAPGGAS